MRYSRKHLVVFLIVLIVILFLWLMISQWDKIATLLSYIFYGIVFSYLLSPISRWLEKFIPRTAAVIFLFLSIIAILMIFVLLFLPRLIDQTTELIERLPLFSSQIKTIIGNMQGSLKEIGLPYSIQVTLNEFIEELEQRLLQRLKQGMDGALDGAGRIAGFLTVPVLSFYFIKDREYFRRIIIGMIPAKIKRRVLQVSSEINQILHSFIRGEFLTALTVGILITIGYWIIGLPYAMVLGLVAAIFEFIPYFGPFLGAVPAVIIAILNSPSKIMWTIIIVVVAQQLEGNILAPKIMGAHVGLHPVYIITVLWIGGTFFGILGMLFAVPSILIIRIIFKNIYNGIVSSPWQSQK